jgi:hypothetical protein
MGYPLNRRYHHVCEMENCRQKKSYPPTSSYCGGHRCESSGCVHPTFLGKAYCRQCTCEQEGCEKQRSRFDHQRFHRFCTDHRCVRCMTRLRIKGSTKCEDCHPLCHETGEMCHSPRASGSMFCEPHTCRVNGCQEYKYDHQSFCRAHRCTTLGCKNRRSDSDVFCHQCLERCLERYCHNLRPIDHAGPYYCEHHGCHDCHAAPRYTFRERRQVMASTLCKPHHDQRGQWDHIVYEVYKIRKIVEANAILDAGDTMDTCPTPLRERAVKAVSQMPRIMGVGMAEKGVWTSVWRNLQDDVFTDLLEYFPRPPRFLSFSRATDADLLSLKKAWEPWVCEMNDRHQSVDIHNPMEYSRLVRQYFGIWTPYRRERLPRIDLDLLDKKLVVYCNREAMYRVSAVITAHDREGDCFYNLPEREFAWTIPVVDVDRCSTEGEDVIRFEWCCRTHGG